MATPATIKKPRPRDELWDTLVEILGYDHKDITRNVRGQLNGAIGQLREVQATPQDVWERAQIFRFMYPTLNLTPMGLVNRWADLTMANLTKLMPEKVRNQQMLKFHESMNDGKIFENMVAEGKIDREGNPIKRITK